MFKLTQYGRLEMDSLLNGYANGFITDEELNYMLDIMLGVVSTVNMEF